MRTLVATTLALGLLAAAANAAVLNVPNAGAVDGQKGWHHHAGRLSPQKKAEMHKKWEKLSPQQKAEMKKKMAERHEAWKNATPEQQAAMKKEWEAKHKDAPRHHLRKGGAKRAPAAK